jgi:hypothetical protein
MTWLDWLQSSNIVRMGRELREWTECDETCSEWRGD